MTDVFQIPYHIFLQKENQTGNIDPNIHTKYVERINNIIKNYDCFNINKINTPESTISPQLQKWNQHKNFIKPKHHFYRNYNKPFQIQNNQKPPRKKLGLVQNIDEFTREITSILNKISPQNYDKLKNKICESCIDEKTVYIIVELIVQKTYKDYGFIKLYISLLQSIHCQNENNVHIIENICKNTCHNFFMKIPILLCDISKNIQEENNLSRFLKMKKELYDMNKSLCYLIIYQFLNIPSFLYLLELKNIVTQFGKDNNDEIYDIFIHLIYDFLFIHSTQRFQKETQGFVKTLLEEKNDAVCNKKTEFKWIDLLKMLDFRI